MRMLIIEKLNDEKADLLCLTGEQANQLSLTDDKVQEINQSLLAQSFDEVIQKFEPSIFMTLDTAQKTVSVSREQLRHPLEQRVLVGGRESVFHHICQLTGDIRAGRYAMTELTDVEDGFWTVEGMEELFLAKRERLFALLREGETKKARRQMQEVLCEADNARFLLHRFMKIAVLTEQDEKREAALRFVLQTSRKGQLDLVAVSERFLQHTVLSPRVERQYTELLADCLEEGTQGSGLCNRALLDWNMRIGCTTLTQPDLDRLKKARAEYQTLYQETMKQYWWAAKPMLQTLFHMYEIFQQKGQETDVLTANCSLEELNRSRNREALERFLETTNTKLYAEQRIHAAVLPNVQDENTESIRQLFERYQIQTHIWYQGEGEKLGDYLIGRLIREEEMTREQALLVRLLNEIRVQREE